MTRGTGAEPGASSLSTRRGTPRPAGRSPGSLCDSRTRTRTGTLLPRGRRALPSPRPPLAAPDSDGTHHDTLSGTPSSPRDHGADSRKSTTVDPRGDGPVPECPRPTPGATRAVSKYFDRPGAARDSSSLPPGPRQAPQGPRPVHLTPGQTDLKSHSTPTEGKHGRNRDVTDRY